MLDTVHFVLSLNTFHYVKHVYYNIWTCHGIIMKHIQGLKISFHGCLAALINSHTKLTHTMEKMNATKQR